MSVEQIVVFSIGEQNYGVKVNQVQSIERMMEVTKVPNTIAFIRGVVHLRGDVVPVIDMRHRVGQSTASDVGGIDQRMIVVSMGQRLVGIIVDAVHDVHNVEAEQIEQAPKLVGGLEARYLDGIVPLESGLLILLNLERILSDAEEEQLAQVERSISE